MRCFIIYHLLSIAFKSLLNGTLNFKTSSLDYSSSEVGSHFEKYSFKVIFHELKRIIKLIYLANFAAFFLNR